jgi:hypothetical protein
MLEPWITHGPDFRDCLLDSAHGDIACLDRGPRFTDQQLLDFTTRTLAARTHCTCFGPRVWLAPRPPDHVTVTLHVYAQDQPDGLEHERPRNIPPTAVSLAGWRYFGTREPDDHPLEQDLALTRWWRQQRDLGLLPNDDA